jgi:hypothetical protein
MTPGTLRRRRQEVWVVLAFIAVLIVRLWPEIEATTCV